MNQAQEPIKAPNTKKAGNKRLSDPNGSTGPQKGAAKQSGLASSKPLASSPAIRLMFCHTWTDYVLLEYSLPHMLTSSSESFLSRSGKIPCGK